MYECKLLEVQDHFQLTGIGLTVHPDFSVPQNGKWNDYQSKAKVITPEGKETVIKVHIGTWHFNIRDHEVDIDKRWRVILSFPDGNKDLIPIGSEVFVTEKDFKRIRGSSS